MPTWWADAAATGREAVALEFANGSFIALLNTSENDLEFEVEGSEVAAALALAQECNMGEVKCFWHTHRLNPEPSRRDLEEFPKWLKIGRILVLADGSITTYNEYGTISRTPSPESARS